MSEQDRDRAGSNEVDRAGSNEVEAHRSGVNRAGTGRAGAGRADEPKDEALTEDEVEAHKLTPRNGT